MHLRSLSLRNYRVYRSLDLEFPDGLIGIYGPNGSGKTTLVEAIRYSLYGESRTDKAELRSADVREDLRVELVFGHEGNSYEVRRRLKGASLTPEVEVYRNNRLAVQSVREANAFLTRVVGMDARAFLASVCAQQKELAAFAGMAPAERRRLVLDLLGVSPIERALARAREQARDARATAAGARAALPDLAALEAAAAEAAAELAAAEAAAAAAAGLEAQAAERLAAARRATAAAEAAARTLATLRGQAGIAQAEAAAARAEAERHEARAAAADALGPEIAAAEATRRALAEAAAPLASLDRAREASLERAGLVRALDDARGRLGERERERADACSAAAGQDGLAAARAAAEDELATAERALAACRERSAELRQANGAADARLDAAVEAAEGGAGLDPDAPCPTCGQPLGERWVDVRARLHAELADARAAAAAAAGQLDAATAERQRLGRRRDELAHARDAARTAEQRAVQAAALAAAAARAVQAAAGEVAVREQALAAVPDPGFDAAAWQQARDAAARLQTLAADLADLRARQRQAEAERTLAKQALARADEADGRAGALRAQAGLLGAADERLGVAQAAERAAAAEAAARHGQHQAAGQALAAARRRAGDQRAAVDAARERHEHVAALEEEAAYLARLVDLLAAFRLHLVSRLGSRLSAEAGRLFAELTDHEYQDLVVDPETYAIRIADAGATYELDRFSGSEHDLASLALRVAVSLVIAESAGELGVLVLDEVLGSLDRDRRQRMLAALTALQGRFRQVLLVTHDDEVKDLLPAAIEVRKGPHRTSTAALVC